MTADNGQLAVAEHKRVELIVMAKSNELNIK